MQMSFLPKIDRKAMQKRVGEALETARIYANRFCSPGDEERFRL
ncbi:hypothetical protein [Aneurinibacillus danicus]|jgi:hypothetical protein|uniref:Uncharacterized protein n=1 Tax=Aneurinibacillus danicus TaxID=267746 RepID=A0A511VCD8_9BACL|nr:hypothetical protein [Aneurinibacillus danicus]GEN35223.1 hypothetical protein ADA01nite_26830 [Aneurinibacillus danicus]